MTCHAKDEPDDALDLWLEAYGRGEEFVLALHKLGKRMKDVAEVIEPLVAGVHSGVVMLLDHRDGVCACKACPARPMMGDGGSFTVNA